MRRPGWQNIAPIVIAITLAGAWITTGLALCEWCGFLTTESALISARAVLAARSDLLTFASLGVPKPPLAYLAAIPFAGIGLPHPAVWVSALAGAGLIGWLAYSFRRVIASRPALVLLLVAAALLPGVFHSAVTGSATVLGLFAMVVAIQLAARFALEEQNLREARRIGWLSAWIDPEREQAHAIRFLWAAALMLGLASLANRGLLLALPIFLLATPLLLPSEDRRNGRKVVTIALLLFLPMATVQALWHGLSWAFGKEWEGLLLPTSAAVARSSVESFRDGLSWSLRSPVAAAAYLSGGLLLTGPVLIYVLARLRNAAVALLCTIPFVIELVAMLGGRSQLSQAWLSLAPLLAVMLILLGTQLHRLSSREVTGLTLATFAAMIFGWQLMATSPLEEERAWRRLLAGYDVRTFTAERQLAELIESTPTAFKVLADDSNAFAVIALLNDASRFVLPHEQRFQFTIDNPHVAASHALLRDPQLTIRPDLVSRAWSSLGADKTDRFRTTLQIGGWQLLENETPFTAAR